MSVLHREIEDLLGAYVLDAVEPDERAAVEAHLPLCPRCRAEVQELREVASLIASSGAPAPDGVWDRIASSLEDTPPPMRLTLLTPTDADADAGGEATVAPAAPTPLRRPAARRPRWVVAVAAAVAAVVGVAGFTLGRSTDGTTTTATGLAAAAQAAFGEPGSRSTDLTTALQVKEAVAVVRRNGEGYLLGENLPALEAGRLYQLWGQTTDGTVLSLGVLDKPGVMAFHVDGTVDTLMITEEEHPVASPSGSPVLAGSLA